MECQCTISVLKHYINQVKIITILALMTMLPYKSGALYLGFDKFERNFPLAA